MENPPLDKIIEKLEKLDIRQWKWEIGSYFGQIFTAEAGGLIFKMYQSLNYVFLTEKPYHRLEIEDYERHILVEYNDKGKNSFEEKKISQFYAKLHERLNTHRTAEFSDMLDNFLSEETDYKTSMKNPELEKIIAKLEQLDTQQWEWHNAYYGSTFTTNISGLTFYLRRDKKYHKLIITNREENVQVCYANSEKFSFEEEKITGIYEKLRQTFEKDKHTKFNELINTFLSE